MENAPVINIAVTRVLPQEEERYHRWINDGYFPLMLRSPWVTGFDRYRIVNEGPDYPRTMSIQHFTDMEGWVNYNNGPELAAVKKDFVTWHREAIWYGCFQLMRSFRGGLTTREAGPSSLVDDAPVLHLSAFDLTSENAEKYNSWLAGHGRKIYFPILARLPGLKVINCYRWTGKSQEKEVKDPNYPRHVSLVYFESIKAYESYAESPELEAFHEALKVPFPGGLDYRWNAQYQLMRSWRK